MNKKSQTKATPIFHYLVHAKGDRSQFDHLKELTHPLEELKYLTSKAPSTGMWFDLNTGEQFFRPKIGEVYVSMTENHKRYPTVHGAYRVAIKIKAAMLTRVKELELAYERRENNHRIINQHYFGRNVAI